MMIYTVIIYVYVETKSISYTRYTTPSNPDNPVMN